MKIKKEDHALTVESKRKLAGRICKEHEDLQTMMQLSGANAVEHKFETNIIIRIKSSYD